MQDYLTNKFLKHNWEVKGEGFTSYKEAAKQFDDTTVITMAPAKPDAIFSLVSGTEKRPNDFRGILIKDDFSLEDFFHSLLSGRNCNLNYCYTPKSAILGKGNDSSLLTEVSDSRTILVIDKKARLIRPHTITEIAKTTNLSGTGLAMNPDSFLERNIYLMKKLPADKQIQFIMRSYNDITVIDGVRSAMYPHFPMCGTVVSIIESIPTSFGTPVVGQWQINHYQTRVSVLYPDKAKEFQELYELREELIPGIEIVNSDVGSSSLFVRSFWALPSGKYFYQTTLKREHSGNINFESIAADVETHIFPEFEAIPKQLCELLSIKLTENVYDPVTGECTRLTTNTNNRQIIDRVLKSVFKQIGMNKACRSDETKTKGKTISVKLREQIESSIDVSSSITAFDVCLAILTLPEYMEKKYASLANTDSFKKTIGLAPFANYRIKNEEVKEEEMIDDDAELSIAV